MPGLQQVLVSARLLFSMGMCADPPPAEMLTAHLDNWQTRTLVTFRSETVTLQTNSTVLGNPLRVSEE